MRRDNKKEVVVKVFVVTRSEAVLCWYNEWCGCRDIV